VSKDYRSFSMWLDGLPGELSPRPALSGSVEVDVAIVGGGYTGLWTAYYLKKADPSLRIAIVEKEIAGFGASGRNGGWCSSFFAASPGTIAAEFGRRDVHVGPGQVDRLLVRYGTHRSSVPRVRGPRYERGTPNELWHIDLKGPFYLRPEAGPVRTCHFVALVDDHSRYLLGIRAVPSKEALAILDVLGEAIELCGIPLALMTDNGTPFVAIARSMMSRFQRTLAELSVRHIRTQIDTPWTNGKIEAFWATLQAEVLDRQQLADLAAAEVAVTAYASYYNYHRLHGELDWQTPAERFDGTPFTDRGFGSVPSLAGVADLLDAILAA